MNLVHFQRMRTWTKTPRHLLMTWQEHSEQSNKSRKWDCHQVQEACLICFVGMSAMLNNCFSTGADRDALLDRLKHTLQLDLELHESYSGLGTPGITLHQQHAALLNTCCLTQLVWFNLTSFVWEGCKLICVAALAVLWHNLSGWRATGVNPSVVKPKVICETACDIEDHCIQVLTQYQEDSMLWMLLFVERNNSTAT